MKADELIAALAAEGELDSDGAFTLDPTVALDKLREFQLRDPTRFVLSWVRAANLLGATRIDVEADADDVWVRFDGEALGEAEFEALWSAVVGQRGSARMRACRELALGINGAFAWEAKSVVVHTGELRVAINRTFEMTRTKAEAATPTTIIHAKRPLGWELVRRRMLDARGQLPEELHLARSCARGRVPVILEGRKLEARLEDNDRAWLYVDFEDDQRRGWLRLRPGVQSSVRVLVAGVEVTTVELPWGSGMIQAHVDDPLLPLDLSQERPVEGQRWRALLELISRVRWQAWFQLAKRHGLLAETSGELAAARQALIDDIFAADSAAWTEAPGALEFADRLVLPRAVVDPLGDLELLGEDAPGSIAWPWQLPKPSPLTLGELVRSARERGELFTSPVPREDLAYVPELPVLLHEPTVGLRALGHVVLDRPVMLERYRRAVAQLRPTSAELRMPEHWLELQERVRVGDEVISVRVAWQRGANTGTGSLSLCEAGRCIARYALPPRWGPLWAEVEWPAVVEHERALALSVLASLARVHDLLAALDGERLLDHERAWVHDYLREAYGRWSARRLDQLEHIDVAARREAVATWPGPWGVPDEWLDPQSRERGVPRHPVADLACVPRLGGHASLRDIQRELMDGEPLVWVEPFQTEPAPPEVWRLGPGLRTIIADVFHGSLAPFDHHAWRRRLPGAHTIPAQLPDARVSTTLQGEAGERGILALAAAAQVRGWSRLPRRGARLQLLARGHALGWMDVPLPIGSFFGVIEVPQARAVSHGDVAVKDQAWRAAAAVVEAGAMRLAGELLDAWTTGQHQAHDVERVRDWLLDLEHGSWPSFAAALFDWQAKLAIDHPLRVNLESRP